jgi:RNA polymerase sigma-70 factor (ECF subfamily)
LIVERAERFDRAVRGDERALDDLIRPLLRPGYRLAYLMLENREAAEDAVQNAALKAWRKLVNLTPERSPLPWFLGFVANECRNSRRSRWRSVITLGDRDDIAAPDLQSVRNLDLARALRQLRDRDRLLVLLRFYLDMSIEEMAEATRSRPAAVRSRLYRATKQLKRSMAMEDLA